MTVGLWSPSGRNSFLTGTQSARLSDWLRGLVTPTLTYPMMHSRLCLIGSLSDSSDNEAECFLQDTVCFHVFGVNEFGIM